MELPWYMGSAVDQNIVMQDMILFQNSQSSPPEDYNLPREITKIYNSNVRTQTA
jgi:hypothetical protein